MTGRVAEKRLGIDIGGTATKLALIEGGRAALATSDRYTKPDRQTLAEAIRSAASRLGVPLTGTTSAGLCVPGIANEVGDRIEIAVNLPGLVGWPFDELVRETGVQGVIPTRVNDAQAATFDWVVRHGVESGGTGSVLGIAMGTGVGMAMLRGGMFVTAVDGGVGHLGQIDVSVGPHSEAPIGPDGGRGGLEAYVGAHAVLAAGGLAPAFAPGSPGSEALIRALRICHAMLRPDVIVLLGGIGTRLATCAHIESGVRAGLTSIARPGWRLAFGDDDHHAARGAALCGGTVAGP